MRDETIAPACKICKKRIDSEDVEAGNFDRKYLFELMTGKYHGMLYCKAKQKFVYPNDFCVEYLKEEA